MERTYSYPTTKSRLLAFAGLAIFLAVSVGRALSEPWAFDPRWALPVLIALFVLSRRFNIQVSFRPAANEREQRLVLALKIAQAIGLIAMIGSIIWFSLITPARETSLLPVQLAILVASLFFSGDCSGTLSTVRSTDDSLTKGPISTRLRRPRPTHCRQ